MHSSRIQNHRRVFVTTDDDHSKKLICWKVMLAFAFALFMWSCLWISVMEFLRVILGRQALPYQGSFEAKKIEMGIKDT